MRAVGEIEGVAGVHLMGYRNDEVLAEAIVGIGNSPPASARARRDVNMSIRED